MVAALTDDETLRQPARVKAHGREVYKMLLSPCKERIQGKNLVLIVPGGSWPLCRSNCSLGKTVSTLIENHQIRYAPSLTALHFINLWQQKRAKPEVPLPLRWPIRSMTTKTSGQAATSPLNVA